MEFTKIVTHLKLLLKDSEGAQEDLLKFERNMTYTPPELFFSHFWNGTMSSLGICNILSIHAGDNQECHNYFQKVVNHYSNHKELKHVET